jgi:hypothetical protein
VGSGTASTHGGERRREREREREFGGLACGVGDGGLDARLDGLHLRRKHLRVYTCVLVCV